MCNAYRVGPDASQRQSKELAQVVEGLSRLPRRFIRRTDQGWVVVRGELVEMRWGFQRSWKPGARPTDINNTRSDNLTSRTWAEAIRERRCLVPIEAFYEFTGPAGRKTAHEFRRREGGLLWVAGVWEDHPTLGFCYSTLSTEPGPVMEPIHDRQLAVLRDDQLDAYVAGAFTPEIRPSDGVDQMLAVAVAPNPLIRRPNVQEDSGPEKGTGPPQGELF